MFWQINGEADLDKPSTVEIDAHSMLLFDLGSAGYTDFNWNGADLLECYEKDENLYSYRAGHVHSHHGMGA